MNKLRLFCPATVANVSVGYDSLGFCLDSVGDEMIFTKTDQPGITISEIQGYELPLEIDQNVAGISALAIYKSISPSFGIDIKIKKNIKPGSGIGSSAASACGAVFGVNELLGDPYSKRELVEFALEGESFASKSRHADNLAPCLYGGFTLVRSVDPVDIIELPVPADLFATVIHPQIELKTSDSRSVIPSEIPLKNAIKQWSEMGSFVHAMHTSNYELLSSCLNDHVIEPYRGKLIPCFEAAREAAMNNGSLALGISGSGPSIFALSKSETTARSVEQKLIEIYKLEHIEVKSYVSGINLDGIKILSQE